MIMKLREKVKYAGLAVLDISFVTVNNGPFVVKADKDEKTSGSSGNGMFSGMGQGLMGMF